MDDEVDAVGQARADAHAVAVRAQQGLVDPRPCQLADQLSDGVRVVLMQEGALPALLACALVPGDANTPDNLSATLARRALAAG
eukprot:7961394-Alexandrium_andersonii.AAC.1